METPDLSLLTASIGQFGGEVFRQNINTLDVSNRGIRFYKNVKQPIILPKLSVTGEPRPYRAADDTTDPVSIADRILTVWQSKWDYDIDPEHFRNTYLASYKKGDAQFADWINQAVAEEYLAAINDNTLYLGVRNAAGTGAADLASGWGTIIAAEIIAANITPVVTGAITSSNAVAKVKAVCAAAPVWMRKKGFRVKVSYDVFDKYMDNYAATFGFKFDQNETESYRINNVKGFLEPESWMGTSQRIIVTVDNNLVMGTDSESVTIAASMRRNIIESRPMMPIGLQIADLEALVVNDQA